MFLQSIDGLRFFTPLNVIGFHDPAQHIVLLRKYADQVNCERVHAHRIKTQMVSVVVSEWSRAIKADSTVMYGERLSYDLILLE